MKPVRLALLLCATTQASSLFGAWDGMRTGMSRVEASGVVGAPSIASIGRGGFEAWTYEHGGEVMFFRGAVLFWSVPKSGADLAPARKPDAEPAEKAAPKPQPKPTVPHFAHNCFRPDCPIHSPARAHPPRK